MSRIGRKPIEIKKGVNVEIKEKQVKVVGAKGTLSLTLPQVLEIKKENDHIFVLRKNDESRTKALHGLFRAHIANMIKGVSEGFEKTLELSGVGYRASLDGKKVVLSVGYSHTVEVIPPEGITFQVEAQTKVKVSGCDKQMVGQVAANIRAVRKVEPYKGKGIKYLGERVRRKAGKAAKAGGSGA